MKSELPKVKAENPNLEHKAAFKLVAERWKNSPDNPKVYHFCVYLFSLNVSSSRDDVNFKN